MTEFTKVEVGLFFAGGALCTIGGLLWTGIYLPHHGGVGFTMFVLGAACAAIFWGLTDENL